MAVIQKREEWGVQRKGVGWVEGNKSAAVAAAPRRGPAERERNGEATPPPAQRLGGGVAKPYRSRGAGQKGRREKMGFEEYVVFASVATDVC